MMRFTSSTFTVDAAAADGSAKRTITGIALPYNVQATVSGGQVVSFLPGSLPVTGKAPKLYMQHDSTQAIGLVTERADSPEAMYFTAKVSSTALGNEALILASDGVLDSVSVGVNPTKFTYDEDGTMIVEAADWLELSLVPQPAFAGATITDVAASIPTLDEEISNNTETAPDAPTHIEPSENPVSQTPAPEIIEASTIFATPKRRMVLPSAGQFMAAYHAGGDTYANMNVAVAEYTESQRTNIEAAAGDQITTDVPGLLNSIVLGPLVQDINFIRPTINALGARAYPDGGTQKTFIRPTIGAHSSVAAQANELATVSATTMTVTSNSVGKTTFAGSARLSIQDIDFTSPAAMQQIITDLMGQMMMATDNMAADNLLTSATSSGVWDGTVVDLLKSVFDAAIDVSTGRNFLPTHMFVSPDVWGQMGQLVDTTNRPVFPFIGAGLTGQNALGAGNATSWNGIPFGLQLVVDSNFAAKTMIITRAGTGFGDSFEYYENGPRLLSVDEPTTLGKVLSTHQYSSSFAAIPGMIRKITQV